MMPTTSPTAAQPLTSCRMTLRCASPPPPRRLQPPCCATAAAAAASSGVGGLANSAVTHWRRTADTLMSTNLQRSIAPAGAALSLFPLPLGSASWSEKRAVQ